MEGDGAAILSKCHPSDTPTRDSLGRAVVFLESTSSGFPLVFKPDAGLLWLWLRPEGDALQYSVGLDLKVKCMNEGAPELKFGVMVICQFNECSS